MAGKRQRPQALYVSPYVHSHAQLLLVERCQMKWSAHLISMLLDTSLWLIWESLTWGKSRIAWFMDEGSPSEIWLRQRTPVICLLVRYYKNLNLSTYKKMEVKQSYNSASSKRRHKSRHIKSRADYSAVFLCCNWITVAFDCWPHKTRYLKMSGWDFENGDLPLLLF